jgi:hypothetical protein
MIPIDERHRRRSDAAAARVEAASVLGAGELAGGG